jgi:hypothetical protein
MSHLQKTHLARIHPARVRYRVPGPPFVTRCGIVASNPQADLNGDGKREILVATRDAKLQVCLHTEVGTLQHTLIGARKG